MKKYFYLSIFALFLCPGHAQCYVLNGLDYSISGDDFRSYNEIVQSLEGTNRRLATAQEMRDLFDALRGTEATRNQLGFGQYYMLDEFTALISGMVQVEDGQQEIQMAMISLNFLEWMFPPWDRPPYDRFDFAGERVGLLSGDWLYSLPIDLDSVPFDTLLVGTGAWIVTPIAAEPVPEPSTLLLFSAGLLGVCATARRKSSKN